MFLIIPYILKLYIFPNYTTIYNGETFYMVSKKYRPNDNNDRKLASIIMKKFHNTNTKIFEKVEF